MLLCTPVPISQDVIKFAQSVNLNQEEGRHVATEELLEKCLSQWAKQNPSNASIASLMLAFDKLGIQSFLQMLSKNIYEYSTISLESTQSTTNVLEPSEKNHNFNKSARFSSLKSVLETIANNWIFRKKVLACLGFLTTAAITTTIIFLCRNEFSTPNGNQTSGLVTQFEERRITNITIHKYTEFFNKLQNCSKSSNIHLKFQLEEGEDWPKQFSTPCQQIVTVLSFKGFIYGGVIHHILREYYAASDILIEGNTSENELADYTNTNLKATSSFHVNCKGDEYLQNLIITQLRVPNAREISFEGIGIDNDFAAKLSDFLEDSKKVEVLKLDGGLGSMNPFFPTAMPSVQTLNLSLRSSISNSIISFAASDICAVFSQLTTLKGRGWFIPLENIKACFGLKHLNIQAQNDGGMILKDIQYFADYLPSLQTLALNLTYSSPSDCLKLRSGSWNNLLAKKSLVSVKVSSHPCSLLESDDVYSAKFRRGKDLK